MARKCCAAKLKISVNFREATLTDIPALSEVRLSVKENALSEPHRITRQMYESYLSTGGKGWLCEVGGQVVGFSVASLNDASIWALFVKPEHEGKGIGKRLLKLATDWLFANGALRIVLTTAPGTRADTWYQKQGWKRGALTVDNQVRFTLEVSAGGVPSSG